MAPKLQEIRTQYHTFVDDQVLTAGQLNGFIHYFDHQERLSRVLLTGVGIICGLAITEVSKNGITLTQGVGITTDGDLLTLREPVGGGTRKNIHLTDLTFTHYRKFDDKSAQYPFFIREGAPMELWELLPNETDGSQPLEDLTDIEEMCLLLYMESYQNEGDLCTVIDCDNQGVESVQRLRVLLVSAKDALFIARQDTIFSKFSGKQKLDSLPELTLRRVVLSPVNTTSYDLIKREYYKAINADGVLQELSEGVSSLYSNFSTLLALEAEKARFDAFPESLKKLIGFTFAAMPVDFQYRYDALKDLVTCWNEIREALLSLWHECFPDIFSFPKHLLLGSLKREKTEANQLRHSFYPSPALSSGKNIQQHCRSLIQRFFQMVEKYQVTPGEIRITPSHLPVKNGACAVPFYYRLDDELLKVWNGHMSYHREKLPNNLRLQDPLSYDIDPYNFFRIEGHQGKNYKEALTKIVETRDRYGLAFDVKMLSLNQSADDIVMDEYESEFDDLNVILRAWTTEQKCVLEEASTLLSGFSTKEPGKNMAEDKIVKGARLARDHFVLQKESLGLIMSKALDASTGGSVNDIIVNANRLVKENVDEESWVKEPETKELVLNQSVQMMAYTHVLTQAMPRKITELNRSRVNSYKLTLKELCALVDKMKTGNEKRKLSTEMKTMMNVLISHLSGICCSGKKLESLLEEIDKRKQRILIGLQLSEFIKKHPGLEHKAGVLQGGTFVLVYMNKKNTVVADFSLPYRCCAGGTAVNYIIQKQPEPEEESCVERTSNAILDDLERLNKLNLSGSNAVIPVWVKTKGIYGNDGEYDKGVIDELDQWINGDHNDKIPKIFGELLTTTARTIIELSDSDSEEYQYVLQIFVLQLTLLHNILVCQNQEVIEKHKDRLARFFEQIYSLISKLVESKVVFPERWHSYLQSWLDRVAENQFLVEHGNRLLKLMEPR